MMALPPIPASVARKIIGCMALLQSPQDGEVIAAARAANRLLEPYGLDAKAIALAALGATQSATKHPAPAVRGFHQDDAAWCLERPCWNAIETNFLKRMVTAATISPNQRSWLNRLCERRGCAA